MPTVNATLAGILIFSFRLPLRKPLMSRACRDSTLPPNHEPGWLKLHDNAFAPSYGGILPAVVEALFHTKISEVVPAFSLLLTTVLSVNTPNLPTSAGVWLPSLTEPLPSSWYTRT